LDDSVLSRFITH